MVSKMRLLFFIVHPSKFHLFRITINKLRTKGHHVDFVIASKDSLENLVKEEGWEYINIFPKGRKLKWIPGLIGSFINLFITIFRLLMVTKGKKYDLFITDDSLGIIGFLRKIHTIHFADDDLSIIGESSFLLKFANFIISPECTNLGKYEFKKILIKGYKQSAYLHPQYFNPDYEIARKVSDNKPYFLIRLVSLTAAHDRGKNGISDSQLINLINLLKGKGKVFISSERIIPEDLEKFKINIAPSKMLHILYYAEFLICDGQSMACEAAMMGTPFIRFNDFIGKISVLNDLERKYILGYGIESNNPQALFKKVEELLQFTDLKKEFKNRRNRMFAEKINLTDFLIWFLESYPKSVSILKEEPDYQLKFL